MKTLELVSVAAHSGSNPGSMFRMFLFHMIRVTYLMPRGVLCVGGTGSLFLYN